MSIAIVVGSTGTHHHHGLDTLTSIWLLLGYHDKSNYMHKLPDMMLHSPATKGIWAVEGKFYTDENPTSQDGGDLFDMPYVTDVYGGFRQIVIAVLATMEPTRIIWESENDRPTVSITIYYTTISI